jgi:DNA-binding response OmpR family regulator
MSKKNKILIVEDDEHLAKIYKLKFEAEGIESIVVSDSEEAVAKVFSEKPDLVLLDLILPKKDGFWVLEQIRQNRDFMYTPVIVLSNMWEQKDKERALILGANDFMVKNDVSIEEVAERIKKA